MSPETRQRPRARATRTREHVVQIWIARREGQFHAIVEDFDVASTGSSPEEAASNVMHLVVDYLNACAADGLSLDEARRPIPLRNRLTFRARAALHLAGSAVQGLRKPLPSVSAPHMPQAC